MMRILIADDEAVSRRVLESTLQKWGFDVNAARDGHEAWQILSSPDAPPIAILDIEMPGFTGTELCRMMRRSERAAPTYLILLTSHTSKESIALGLAAGADDMIGKPFDREELKARLQVAKRVIELEQNLSDRLSELEMAISQIRRLQAMLPTSPS